MHLANDRRVKAAVKAYHEAWEAAERAYGEAMYPLWWVRRDAQLAAWLAFEEVVGAVERKAKRKR